jgi:hypothetical protein
MTPESRINAFIRLGKYLRSLPAETEDEWVQAARAYNSWFTPESVRQALRGIATYLDEPELVQWVSQYPSGPGVPKKVGLVMAGNIPAVGFHDLMCILISGHLAYIKPSSQDPVLLKKITDVLLHIEPAFDGRIHFADMLKGMDAMIATGSDNSARYFNYYFSKIPHIIRQNRTSCAVLTGEETPEELAALGTDILQYFGLGCRNVSKLYVPEHYSFTAFFQAVEPLNTVIHHHKYSNNYEYNKSIYLINQVPHQDNGFLLLTENSALVSPISVVYYEYYRSRKELEQKITDQRNKIQVIVSREAWFPESAAFGEAQQPRVYDYADGVDTLQFLHAL